MTQAPANALRPRFWGAVAMALALGLLAGFVLARMRYLPRPPQPEPAPALEDVDGVYFGFAVDMDAGLVNQPRPETLEPGVRHLLARYQSLQAAHGATWLVNEVETGIATTNAPLLASLVQAGGEIGLHTHLNNPDFGGHVYACSRDATRYFDRGLIEPKRRLESALGAALGQPYEVTAFKAGNHCRGTELFDALIRAGFKYDTTMVYEGSWRGEMGGAMVTMYDDLDLRFGRGPWHVLPEKPYEPDPRRRLLEIPEVLYPNVERWREHIRRLRAAMPAAPVFFVLQVHPFEVADDAGQALYWRRVCRSLTPFERVRFASIRQMAAIWLDYEAGATAAARAAPTYPGNSADVRSACAGVN